MLMDIRLHTVLSRDEVFTEQVQGKVRISNQNKAKTEECQFI